MNDIINNWVESQENVEIRWFVVGSMLALDQIENEEVKENDGHYFTQ